MFSFLRLISLRIQKHEDPIPLWYSIGGSMQIHVTDGGFQDT